MTATELKARILTVLDDVGGGEVVEITKHGRVVARLVPARGAHALQGKLAGLARSVAPDDDLFSTGEPWDAE
jgi:prevent-host-death family protein